uniref:Uncharacterized protein n=1 Tax=Glycine max TaxID=3847 RepID=A0A0R0F6N4_SOYBN
MGASGAVFTFNLQNCHLAVSKYVDQMVIHSASDLRPPAILCGDYFYNYFTCGLDILFDGQTHKIKKFVLHTNFPGHADFNSYIKCNFVVYGLDCSASNPFGSTLVYGYQNIAFEVMKNGYIATITLFQS